MFPVFKTLNSFLKLLNSETAPSQIAAGLAFGIIVGFTPFLSLHNLILFLIVFLFRVNLSMFFLSLAVSGLLAFALDPLFDALGYALLVDLKAARPLWIQLTSGPVLPFFRFNNTIVMGSLIFSLVLFVPAFVGGIWGIRAYRARWRAAIRDSRFMKALKATPLYGIYEKIEAARERLKVFE